MPACIELDEFVIVGASVQYYAKCARHTNMIFIYAANVNWPLSTPDLPKSSVFVHAFTYVVYAGDASHATSIVRLEFIHDYIIPAILSHIVPP